MSKDIDIYLGSRFQSNRRRCSIHWEFCLIQCQKQTILLKSPAEATASVVLSKIACQVENKRDGNSSKV